MKQLYSLIILLLIILFTSCDKNNSNTIGVIINWIDETHGNYTDTRDNIEYNVIKIGDQVWMAENLAYDAGDGCWIYDDYDNNLNAYGRLYNWDTAIASTPIGWHLPTNVDWDELCDFISTDQGGYNKDGDYWENVGHQIKAKNGWHNNGNGIDNYGFTGLPGGHLSSFNGRYNFANKYGFWWSATIDGTPYAFCWEATYDGKYFGTFPSDKRDGFSVRYIKN